MAGFPSVKDEVQDEIVDVNIVGGASIATQYTEGDIDTTFTGIVAIAEGPSNTATPLQVDASKHLQVDIAADSVGIGGGTQYTEDAAAAANPVGNALNLIRDDSLSGQTSDDGDNVAARGTDKGELYVKHVDAIPVTQSGTWDEVGINDSGNSITVDDGGTSLSVDDGGSSVTVDGTVSVTGVSTAANQSTQITAEQAIQTSVELLDDAIKADDAAFTPATTKVMMAGFEYDDTGTDSVDEGDAGAARMSANRNLYVQLRDAGGAERGLSIDASNRAMVRINADDVGLAVESGGNLESLVLATHIEDVASADGDHGVGMLAVRKATPANTSNTDGDYEFLQVNGGKLWVQGTQSEDAAHTTADIGVYVLGVRNDTPNTALTNADADYGSISLYRTGAVRTAIPEEDFAALGSNHVKKYYTNAGAVTDGIVWSPAAGKRWYVTDIFINVSAAATVTLEDDLVAGDSAVWKAELAANSGWSHHFGTPLFSGEDAADLLVTTTAGNVYITVTGYEI